MPCILTTERDGVGAISTPGAHTKLSKYQFPILKNQDSSATWLISGLRQKMYKMSVEHPDLSHQIGKE